MWIIKKTFTQDGFWTAWIQRDALSFEWHELCQAVEYNEWINYKRKLNAIFFRLRAVLIFQKHQINCTMSSWFWIIHWITLLLIIVIKMLLLIVKIIRQLEKIFENSLPSFLIEWPRQRWQHRHGHTWIAPDEQPGQPEHFPISEGRSNQHRDAAISHSFALDFPTRWGLIKTKKNKEIITDQGWRHEDASIELELG